ncbi:hypothetical protein IWQ60_005509 [Tieghemiomyces parasiticus]|uniref:HTH APSES-type domain-containing protein n=1 Tax=Tieghemiomyces parasiticus TaxID=78921 RepID=A0A9W8AEH9_9FUNG|nr:hypothetical protein IWQ60_005509 [Tieghemiomyces parasiticus]
MASADPARAPSPLSTGPTPAETRRVPYNLENLHPDDARDKVFVAILKALIYMGNRPSSPKELANCIMKQRFTMLGGATPYATVSSRISQHFKRAAEHRPPRPPILGKAVDSRYSRKIHYYLATADGPPPMPLPSITADDDAGRKRPARPPRDSAGVKRARITAATVVPSANALTESTMREEEQDDDDDDDDDDDPRGLANGGSDTLRLTRSVSLFEHAPRPGRGKWVPGVPHHRSAGAVLDFVAAAPERRRSLDALRGMAPPNHRELPIKAVEPALAESSSTSPTPLPASPAPSPPEVHDFHEEMMTGHLAADVSPLILPTRPPPASRASRPGTPDLGVDLHRAMAPLLAVQARQAQSPSRTATPDSLDPATPATPPVAYFQPYAGRDRTPPPPSSVAAGSPFHLPPFWQASPSPADVLFGSYVGRSSVPAAANFPPPTRTTPIVDDDDDLEMEFNNEDPVDRDESDRHTMDEDEDEEVGGLPVSDRFRLPAALPIPGPPAVGSLGAGMLDIHDPASMSLGELERLWASPRIETAPVESAPWCACPPPSPRPTLAAVPEAEDEEGDDDDDDPLARLCSSSLPGSLRNLTLAPPRPAPRPAPLSLARPALAQAAARLSRSLSQGEPGLTAAGCDHCGRRRRPSVLAAALNPSVLDAATAPLSPERRPSPLPPAGGSPAALLPSDQTSPPPPAAASPTPPRATATTPPPPPSSSVTPAAPAPPSSTKAPPTAAPLITPSALTARSLFTAISALAKAKGGSLAAVGDDISTLFGASPPAGDGPSSFATTFSALLASTLNARSSQSPGDASAADRNASPFTALLNRTIAALQKHRQEQQQRNAAAAATTTAASSVAVPTAAPASPPAKATTPIPPKPEEVPSKSVAVPAKVTTPIPAPAAATTPTVGPVASPTPVRPTLSRSVSASYAAALAARNEADDDAPPPRPDCIPARLPVSPRIYLTLVESTPFYILAVGPRQGFKRTHTLLRRADTGYVNAERLLGAGGVETDQERSIVLSLEVDRYRYPDPLSELYGSWIPLPRARALAATCSLHHKLGPFLNDNLQTYFPAQLPPAYAKMARSRAPTTAAASSVRYPSLETGAPPTSDLAHLFLVASCAAFRNEAVRVVTPASLLKPAPGKHGLAGESSVTPKRPRCQMPADDGLAAAETPTQRTPPRKPTSGRRTKSTLASRRTTPKGDVVRRNPRSGDEDIEVDVEGHSDG